MIFETNVLNESNFGIDSLEFDSVLDSFTYRAKLGRNHFMFIKTSRFVGSRSSGTKLCYLKRYVKDAMFFCCFLPLRGDII